LIFWTESGGREVERTRLSDLFHQAEVTRSDHPKHSFTYNRLFGELFYIEESNAPKIMMHDGG